jgi:hypothetical protein
MENVLHHINHEPITHYLTDSKSKIPWQKNPKENPLQVEIGNPLARESNPKYLAIQESKIPWQGNCKGILAIAILSLQMKNPKPLDKTRLSPVISDAKRMAPYKS